MIVPWDTVCIEFLSSLCLNPCVPQKFHQNEALLHIVNMVHMHQNDVQLFHKLVAVEASWHHHHTVRFCVNYTYRGYFKGSILLRFFFVSCYSHIR